MAIFPNFYDGHQQILLVAKMNKTKNIRKNSET